jgi:hypothetical protein
LVPAPRTALFADARTDSNANYDSNGHAYTNTHRYSQSNTETTPDSAPASHATALRE